MSWADYHLDDPTFCTPEIVAEGLVRALTERARAFYIAKDGQLRNYYFYNAGPIIPSTFYWNDRFYKHQFCRKFDAYLAWYAWAGTTTYGGRYCPIGGALGPSQPCEKTCQYYPWYGRDNTCHGYQTCCVDENGDAYTLRSLLAAIGDKDLIDTSTLNTNQPSLFVPWVHQRVKMLKKLRYFGNEGYYPRIVWRYTESDWYSTESSSPYSTAQDAVNSVPRRNKSVDEQTSSISFSCYTVMSGDKCVQVESRLPISAAPGFDSNVPNEFKPKRGYFAFNVDDPYIATFNLLSAEGKVVKGLNIFELQEDGSFFSNWPTSVTLPADLPDTAWLGFDLHPQHVYYDFNSTFEFQDED